ncbi:ASCH domain-containing protein [Bordetella genomosp. 8]|uniref:ASCH domain-containing protein n=1 Tax=Bordetella genomosp. 8 TaxID=1416806 RepID=UPI001E54B04D|nr:ASCH domain-containing protein [Bordetella genomosp. 8]
MKAQPLRFDRNVIDDVLAGRKVQARRILKPQPPDNTVSWLREIGPGGKWMAVEEPPPTPSRRRIRRMVCPYGEPGQSIRVYDDAGTAFGVVTLVGVRIQRLQDISEADVVAEGCAEGQSARGGFLPGMPLKSIFAVAWCETNGARAWAVNPWVWALEFRLTEALPYDRQALPPDVPQAPGNAPPENQ